MENTFNFKNPYIGKSIWAKPSDFRMGKQIKIINFETLLKGEGNPPAKFVDEQWNGTYRLTFENVEGDIQYFECRYHSFAQDMQRENIKPNQIGIMSNGKDFKNRWVWKWIPVD